MDHVRKSGGASTTKPPREREGEAEKEPGLGRGVVADGGATAAAAVFFVARRGRGAAGARRTAA